MRADRALARVAAVVSDLNGWARRGAAVAAGAATALAFAPLYALPLMALGYSVLVILLDSARTRPRPLRASFLIGWLFGVGFYLVGLYWMAFSFFVQADEFAWMAPFALFGMPAFLGLFAGAAAALASALWRAGWRRIFIFAAVWMIFEYARGHVLTGLPWNLPGQAFAGAAIGAQSAAWIGVYGLSLLAVLLAAAPVAFAADGRILRGVAVSLAGAALIYFAGALRLAAGDPGEHKDIFVRIVQPNIPQREKIEPALFGRNFARHLTLSKGDAPGFVYVIWPENAAPLVDESPAELEAIRDALPNRSVLLTGTVRRAEDETGVMRYYNSIAIIPETPSGRAVAAHYDKHHLVPFGEYLPLQSSLRAVGLAQLAPYDDGFTPGPGPWAWDTTDPSFAPLICYEAIFPGEIYPKGARPQWLVAVTNDAWFGDTSGPRQHLDQARLRAIETGLPMARSANTGISALIDAKGRLLRRIQLYTEGRIDAPLPRPLPATLYTRLGDIGFMILSLVVLLIGFWRKTPARDSW